jgi:carboxypeptidase Taq
VDSLKRLDVLMAELTDLRSAAALLSWDERVGMPPGAASTHGEMLATIKRVEHEKFTSKDTGALIEEAKTAVSALDADAPARRKVAVTARDFDKATRVPSRFVVAHTNAVSAAHQAWRQAREQSDFRRFEPHLKRVLELKREYVSFFAPADHPYDVLLDDYEPGARTAEIQGMFDALRPRQVALAKAVQGRPAVDDGFLHVPYAKNDLLEFAIDVISGFGFDWTRGRQDMSAHPFAAAISSSDVRITTRFVDRNPFELLFGMLHEAGHALYEQGVSSEWDRTSLIGGTSLGVHESQSRLWENIVGRSIPFWMHFYPGLQKRFPSQLANVTLDQFYGAITRVKPSLIRVEADEVTYNLHVMLRVEMEIALLTGSLDTKDAEECWNSKMAEYLGVTPGNSADGVLQDMHWSVGLFGYFPTYVIGNVVSAQLWSVFQDAEPAWEAQIRAGDFASLRAWLQREIHQHGRRYQPRELVRRVTGNDIDAERYLTYLETKYS